jgi:hypothetical protein
LAGWRVDGPANASSARSTRCKAPRHASRQSDAPPPPNLGSWTVAEEQLADPCESAVYVRRCVLEIAEEVLE